jgi:hypothetical protein
MAWGWDSDNQALPDLAPAIPKNETAGHSGEVVECPPHALPFGIIFEEYAVRRKADLEDNASEVFFSEKNEANKAKALPKLKQWLADRNKKYKELDDKKDDPDTLSGEIDALEKECSEFDKPLKQILHKMNGSAVCLSGGGIRSASFGLGVLEGLARFSIGRMSPAQHSNRKDDCKSGLLHHLDYLSTVSGGGYIGSWMTAWIHRRHAAEVRRAERELEHRSEAVKQAQAAAQATAPNPGSGPPPAEATRAKVTVAEATHAAAAAVTRLAHVKRSWQPRFREVVRALAGEVPLTSGDPAPQPVRHLRSYTSYLAPALGLSLDSWDLVAIVLRNLLVNWVMLAPLLFVVVALPQVSYQVTRNLHVEWNACVSWVVLGLVFFLFVIAARFAGRSLPSHRADEDTGPGPGQVALRFVGPVLLANWILAQLWEGNHQWIKPDWAWVKYVVFLVAEAGFFVLALKLYRIYTARLQRDVEQVKAYQSSSDLTPEEQSELQRKEEWARGRKKWLRTKMQAAGLVSAGVTTLLLWLLATYVFPTLLPCKPGLACDDRLYTILAFPLITMVPLISHSLFAGLVGVFEREEDREWLSRAGGLQMAVIVAWAVGHGIAVYATDALTVAVGLITGSVLGGLGSALGWSGATSAGPRPVKAAQLGKMGSFLTKHDLLLPTLCAIALLFLTLGAAGAEYALAKRLLASAGAPTLAGHFVILVVASAAAFLANWAINVNLFSLHGMYRMRLMRAFLGASNTQRDPDKFTQFDPKDTPYETDLAAAPDTPLHVINTTLNLVGTKNLAWRQRKGESFTFSPLYSGSWRLAYVPTNIYAGSRGVTLATAMAISGAAFNPNMGYHSSPLVTLLMTFFNVRLGWWLPNPVREEGTRWPKTPKGDYFLHLTGPTIALEPLVLEAFGMTDDKYRWIELTDGGHFENLGLYEMVLRRCHNILVVDAGADPKCQFEDLGNALRKIEIDLGIPIRFTHGLHMEEGAKLSNRYCAVATIDYACVDGSRDMPDSERAKLAGTLIYLKAGMTGKEPPDVRQYALTHPTFPHESTGNQFFNESQFESYRHLGSYEVETIITEALAGLPAPATWGPSKLTEVTRGMDFDSFALAAQTYAVAPSPPPPTPHTE